MTPVDVIAKLAAHKNVLLEGPPATGKTRLMTEVLERIKATGAATGGGPPKLNALDPKRPFIQGAGKGDPTPLPRNMIVRWVTFHAGFMYEDFVVGKRPIPGAAGFALKPFLGTLMSAATLLTPGSDTGVLLVIDELNRGNVGQVFGEFMTALDPEYRATVRGKANPLAVRPRLPGLRYEGAESEEVHTDDGRKLKLPMDWAFPEQFFVLATMNSVDKAALPLDVAITRRFYRMVCAPDLGELAKRLGLDWAKMEDRAKAVRAGGDAWKTTTAEEVSLLLLERLNFAIAEDVGTDFELGHGLVWPVVEAQADQRWDVLLDVWEHALKPQLAERFAGNRQSLRSILKIGSDAAHSVYTERGLRGSAVRSEGLIELPSLLEVERASAMTTLRWLAV